MIDAVGRHVIARPWIGVDLDGTLADHYWPSKGEYDPLRIGDPIAPMVERIREWMRQGMQVKIFTARVGRNGSAPHTAELEDREAIHAAIEEWSLAHIGFSLEATCEKDYNMVELWDDRAMRVIVNTGERCCDRD